jgi:hypothetical protein
VSIVKKWMFAAVVAGALGLLASEANAQAPSRSSVVPGLNVTPVAGGTVITPSVGVNAPIGGASVQGTVSVPVVVPNGGPAQVTPPTVGLQVVIPIGK